MDEIFRLVDGKVIINYPVEINGRLTVTDDLVALSSEDLVMDRQLRITALNFASKVSHAPTNLEEFLKNAKSIETYIKKGFKAQTEEKK